jgi:glycosidase
MMKDRALRDDPPATREFPLPLHPELAELDGVHSRNDPEITVALEALREAAGDALLVGEVYLPMEGLADYLEQLDLVFAFEFQHAPWRAAELERVLSATAGVDGIAWVLSNHDFPRLATRVGGRFTRAAALLLLTLPGAAFVYQGDEIGMTDGPGGDPPRDRAGRDPHRHPMQWESDADGGFSSGEPWLPPTDPKLRSVAAQRGDPGSLLALYRRLIALRRELEGRLEVIDAPPDMLAYSRGAHVVAINLGEEPARAPARGVVVLATSESCNVSHVPAGDGLVIRRTDV